MSFKAVVFLADGFEEAEALVPCDLLRRAGYEVKLVTINKTADVQSSHKIHIVADEVLGTTPLTYDLLMLPGGMPGTTNLLADERVCSEVKKANAEGKIVTAICAAPMILGQLGLLQGKKATCYPGFEKHLTGAKHQNVPVVTDGNIITGRGAGAAIEFALAQITALEGADKAQAIAKQITLID